MIDLKPYKKQLEEIAVSLNLSSLTNEIKELEQKTIEPGFWDDSSNSGKVLKQTKILKDKLDKYNFLETELEEIEILLELGEEEEALSKEKAFFKEIDAFYTITLLSGEYDKSSAILSINSGAGGTEAQDWASMLLRMYTRWAAQKGYKTEIMDYLEGDGAGIKSATLEVDGAFAYGYLKAERGIHRLVRLSPFDAANKRHTSFASCSVLPIIEDDVEVEIKEEDLRIDTYRSSGAGGQHVNTTDSAVRITHLPTNIVAQCQNERSQIKNRESAMKMLRAKLFERKQEEQKKLAKEIKGSEDDNAFGSQIRSYVMHPYSMVKDHRTNEETGNVKAVMDGEIDHFITSYLKKN